MSSKQRLDGDILAMLKDVMEDEFPVLIDTYLIDAAIRIKALREALDEQDAEMVRITAHSFKGSSSNIGAAPLADLCMVIENSAHKGQLAGIESTLDEVEQEFMAVKQVLSEL
jgi:HPt (histidine-containing phosphotransfer) domain-containing protein|tara:strand:- start:1281 stop:1619 length:339 start_codon:yes stop_codon:yes gene_type:complete